MKTAEQIEAEVLAEIAKERSEKRWRRLFQFIVPLFQTAGLLASIPLYILAVFLPLIVISIIWELCMFLWRIIFG